MRVKLQDTSQQNWLGLGKKHGIIHYYLIHFIIYTNICGDDVSNANYHPSSPNLQVIAYIYLYF